MRSTSAGPAPRADTAAWRRRLAVLAAAGVLVGAAAALLGSASVARLAWIATSVLVSVPLGVDVARSVRRGTAGVDAVALLAILSALAVGELLAAAVVALMVSGGSALEEHAGARARRDLSALLERAPRSAHRYLDGQLVVVDVEEVRPADRLLVKQGEIVPVDGTVASGTAVLDESALTGEALPVEHAAGDTVRSGAVNLGPPFELTAKARAAESTYAAMARLASEADARKAPLARMADRYAALLLPVSVAAAGLAWVWSGDPRRAVAVLVVATPCPLILAVPIALVCGMARGARHGILVKGGAALETLSRARVVLMDKTGTLTVGAPKLTEVVAFGGRDPDTLLRLAASVDQMSSHVYAPAIVREARARGLSLATPSDLSETPGSGIRGTVQGRVLAVGKGSFVAPGASGSAEVRRVSRRNTVDGSSSAFVTIDGSLAGALVLQDPMRSDAYRTVRALRRAGIARVVLVTGDHPLVAEAIGAAVGADAVLAERSPLEKAQAVRVERAHGITVMVGDGVNDAAALAEADVGVALGARGSSASSEAADVVLLVDRLDGLAESIGIAKRSMRIARQSVLAGMGASLLAMGVAGAGFLVPVAGALLQEAIDVAVILNALRALGSGRERRGRENSEARRFEAEHRRLLPLVERLRGVADRLDDLSPGEARSQLEEVRRYLEDQVAPHERSEDALLYPAVARAIGGDDPTAAMSRAHLEIAHLIRLYGRLLEQMDPGGPDAEDRRDLHRILYGLHAVLVLHFAQEDEHYLSLFERQPDPVVR